MEKVKAFIDFESVKKSMLAAIFACDQNEFISIYFDFALNWMILGLYAESWTRAIARPSTNYEHWLFPE